MNSSPWFNKRVAAATFIIVWAGALHFNMMDIQKKLDQKRASPGTSAATKLTIKLSGDTEEE